MYVYAGAFFIDCNPECFDRILEFHATGRLSLTGLSLAQRDILTHSLRYLCSEDLFTPSIMHPPHSENFDIENFITDRTNNNNRNSLDNITTITTTATATTTTTSDLPRPPPTTTFTRLHDNISPELQSLAELAKEIGMNLKNVEEVEKRWTRSEETVCMYVCMYVCNYLSMYVVTSYYQFHVQ